MQLRRCREHQKTFTLSRTISWTRSCRSTRSLCQRACCSPQKASWLASLASHSSAQVTASRSFASTTAVGTATTVVAAAALFPPFERFAAFFVATGSTEVGLTWTGDEVLSVRGGVEAVRICCFCDWMYSSSSFRCADSSARFSSRSLSNYTKRKTVILGLSLGMSWSGNPHIEFGKWSSSRLVRTRGSRRQVGMSWPGTHVVTETDAWQSISDFELSKPVHCCGLP